MKIKEDCVVFLSHNPIIFIFFSARELGGFSQPKRNSNPSVYLNHVINLKPVVDYNSTFIYSTTVKF